MKKAVIALGTNIGDREGNIGIAVDSIRKLPRTEVLKLSKIYETEPWVYAYQDMFLNACVLVKTDLSPHALLGACLGIEAAMGRLRTIKNGPRIIDLDLIKHEGEQCESEELILPHPRAEERDFVQVPMRDLNIDF